MSAERTDPADGGDGAGGGIGGGDVPVFASRRTLVLRRFLRNRAAVGS